MAVTDAALAFDALTIDMSRLVGIMHLLHSDAAQEWTSEQIYTFGELMNTALADAVEAWTDLVADLGAVEAMRAALVARSPAARAMQ
jgi:hypothetical protein